ncbi:MAG: alkaline phosphatase family protein [Planctomycetes bacterium]|nr:alkaline phosphatase family protein [Planctomycetota bacterium]
MQPLLLIDTVGLTERRLALAPRLQALAQAGWQRPLDSIVPAVTCSTQASLLTGKLPQEHGIVGNGWLFRDTMEVRFWQQSNRLLEAEPIYVTARRRAASRGRVFRCAKLFWWFNQGAAVDIGITPKPHYGADGNKAFDILAYPDGLAAGLKKALGDFPFQSFWGPMAGLPSTQWIARCAAEVLRGKGGPPELTLVYLPHLDYDTQRNGPENCDWPKLVGDLDAACEPLLETARKLGVRVWVVNEYSHVQVIQPVLINRALRKLGWLVGRPGPFGETLDTFASRAFAVCDHQMAHVYMQDQADGPRLRDLLASLDGVDRIFVGHERGEIGLDHVRAGDLVLLSKPKAWFAYPYWLDDRAAPDFARTVDIHRKPGYDPCELFFDPKLLWAKGRAIRKLLAKKFGFRTLFDVVPLDANLVKGSHGLVLSEQDDKPVIIGDGAPPGEGSFPMTSVRDQVLRALCLES